MKKNTNLLQDLIMKRIKGTEMKVTMRMEGVGISFVDSEPKEVLYISIYKIKLQMQVQEEMTEHGIQRDKNIALAVYHMQIDNQIPSESVNKIIIAPEQELDFELMENEDEYVPFLQIKL